MRLKMKNIGLVFGGVIAGILVSIGITAVAQKEPKAPIPLEELQKLSAVFGAIKQNYVEDVEDKKLITDAMSGMMSGLDPHSAYLDKESRKELEEGIKGEFGGLGIEVGAEDGFVKVIAPIEDTPAARAGIKAGDLIIKINEKPTKGLPLNDAVKLMRGKPNTKITLTLARKGDPQPIVVTLTRAVIKVQSVRSKMLEPGTAYIRISQFQEKSAEDLTRHLAKLDKESPLQNIVLDLRNDPGGSLQAAIGVAAAFLKPTDLVVSTKGRIEGVNEEYYARFDEQMDNRKEIKSSENPARAKTAKIVVLVNSGSASASEIVAGALQDHKRAVVMGTQTFGKASVQNVIPFNDGTAIKLTIARYYTPSGRSIQAKGIVPDLLVEETPNGELPGFHLREVDLDKHLSNPKEAEDKPVVPQATDSANSSEEEAKPVAKRKPLEFGSAEDYQLQQAMNYLKGLPVALAKAKPTDEKPGEATSKESEGKEKAATKPAEKPTDKVAPGKKPAR